LSPFRLVISDPSYMLRTFVTFQVIQMRIDGSDDFYRDWSTYKEGFGVIQEDPLTEFWLG